MKTAYRPAVRAFAIILLESRQALCTKWAATTSAFPHTTIARHHAILPNPSQKVASFALISADDMAVWFVDKEREIAGEKRCGSFPLLAFCGAPWRRAAAKCLEAVTTVVGSPKIRRQHGIGAFAGEAYVAENAEGPTRWTPASWAARCSPTSPRRRALRSRRGRGGALPERVVVERPWPSRSPEP
ncbi:MAG: hypothetical protein ACLTDR_10985 [Adlercreutzia equolifaciens]